MHIIRCEPSGLRRAAGGTLRRGVSGPEAAGRARGVGGVCRARGVERVRRIRGVVGVCRIRGVGGLACASHAGRR